MSKEKQIPKTCYGVKCMKEGCRNNASHKIEEVNLWDEVDGEERSNHYAFNNGHNLTTYLCNFHFSDIMRREEEYHEFDPRFKDKPE